MLLNKDYQNQIKQEINNVVENNTHCNPNTLWELIKGTARNISIKLSTMTKKQPQEKEHNLIYKLDSLEQN